MDLRDLRLIIASLAQKRLFLQIGNANQTANITNVDTISIGLIKQAIFQKRRSSMRNDTITLHFSEAKTSIARTSLGWPACKQLNGTSGSRVDLIIHHVLQSLIECRTDENSGGERKTSVTIVKEFVTIVPIA
jgi:hypothetical protein